MNVNRSPFADAPPPQIGYPTPLGQPAQFGQEGDELDIRGLLLPFWRRKWLIALVTLIALALSAYAASQMQPRYTAFARVIFDPERMRIIDLESVIAARDTPTTGLQNQVEILRSFILLERVVDILRLEESPEFAPDEVEPPTIAERIANWLNLPGYAQQYLPENVEEFVPAEIQNRLAELGIMDPTQPIELHPGRGGRDPQGRHGHLPQRQPAPAPDPELAGDRDPVHLDQSAPRRVDREHHRRASTSSSKPRTSATMSPPPQNSSAPASETSRHD